MRITGRTRPPLSMSNCFSLTIDNTHTTTLLCAHDNPAGESKEQTTLYVNAVHPH